jgi:hypothetical protein
MMWFTPVLSGIAVVLVSIVAAALSVCPVLKLQPAVVFERSTRHPAQPGLCEDHDQ